MVDAMTEAEWELFLRMTSCNNRKNIGGKYRCNQLLHPDCEGGFAFYKDWSKYLDCTYDRCPKWGPQRRK